MLEGITESKGGLIIKRKSDDSSNIFKEPPKASLLGLDKLALIRRQEKLEASESKRYKKSENDEKINKNYRKATAETPTHTGGVSYEAKKRAEERLERHRERGVHASTKEKKKLKSEDKHKNYSHRHKHSTSYNDRRSSERSHRSSTYSPRFNDEPKTPNYKMKNPTSKTSWDEDDIEATKKSSWDYPTPSSEKNGNEWSERRLYKSDRRSDRSKKYDDSARPTPAFKYNNWAKDRKRSGATPSAENSKFIIIVVIMYKLYYNNYHIYTVLIVKKILSVLLINIFISVNILHNKKN